MTAKPQSPGPGRATADAAFDEVRKDIARRNAEAQKVWRKARTLREQAQLVLRRERDRQ